MQGQPVHIYIFRANSFSKSNLLAFQISICQVQKYLIILSQFSTKFWKQEDQVQWQNMLQQQYWFLVVRQKKRNLFCATWVYSSFSFSSIRYSSKRCSVEMFNYKMMCISAWHLLYLGKCDKFYKIYSDLLNLGLRLKSIYIWISKSRIDKLGIVCLILLTKTHLIVAYLMTIRDIVHYRWSNLIY